MRLSTFARAPTLLVLLSTAGCAALSPPRPLIENRFREERAVQRDEPLRIAVNVATGPVEEPKGGVPITQLSDRGQAALIEQTKGKPPAVITSSSDGAAAVTIYNSIKRHIVVAIRPIRFLRPGDRVDAIKIKLEIPKGQPGAWSITSWTQASNGEVTIEVGKTTDANSSKVTASSGTGFIGALPNATVGGELAASTTREASIRDSTILAAAVDDNGQAWLDETAGWRVGLSHNLTMDAIATAPLPELRTDFIVSFASLTRDDPASAGKSLPQLAKQVRLNVLQAQVSKADTQPVCGLATLQYRIRQIANEPGRATFSEADDVVQPLEGTAHTSFLFAPAPVVPIYNIGVGDEVLAYQQPGSDPYYVNFTDLGSASAFKDWLVQVEPKNGELANARIGIIRNARNDLRPLTTAERKSANVYEGNRTLRSNAAQASAGACRSPDLAQQVK